MAQFQKSSKLTAIRIQRFRHRHGLPCKLIIHDIVCISDVRCRYIHIWLYPCLIWNYFFLHICIFGDIMFSEPFTDLDTYIYSRSFCNKHLRVTELLLKFCNNGHIRVTELLSKFCNNGHIRGQTPNCNRVVTPNIYCYLY